MIVMKWERIPRRRMHGFTGGGKYLKGFYLVTLECGHQQKTNCRLPEGPERVDRCHTCAAEKEQPVGESK